MKGRPPNKYFFHNGTQYILTGNERLAMSHFHEIRTHLGLLKMTNVHDLPIVFGEKEFDDGTVAKFQLIHGRERINVFAPSYIPPVEEDEEILEIPQEMIVPTIITYNEAGEFIGFTICKSGTFEPPYQFFPNETDFPYSSWFTDREAFLEANLEDYPKDRLKLSSDEMSSDEIFLMLPSGEYPTVSSEFDYFSGDMPQPFMYWVVGDGPTQYTCDFGCFRYFDLSAAVGVDSRFWTTELWGNTVPSLNSTQYYTASGDYKGDDLAAGLGWPCAQSSYYMGLPEQFGLDPDGYIDARPAGFIQALNQSWTDSWVEFPGYLDGIMAERADVSHFAACYTREDKIFTQYENREFAPCDYGDLTKITTTVKDTFTLYLNVDQTAKQIGFIETGADGAWFQYEGGLRYYGSDHADGSHSARALCAVLTWFYDSSNTIYTYHHYFSGSDEVVSTAFNDDAGEYRHTINDLTYQDELIYGKGEVILCRYVAGYKEEIKIR